MYRLCRHLPAAWVLTAGLLSFRWCICGYYTIQKVNIDTHYRSCKILAEILKALSLIPTTSNDSGSLPPVTSTQVDDFPPNQRQEPLPASSLFVHVPVDHAPTQQDDNGLANDQLPANFFDIPAVPIDNMESASPATRLGPSSFIQQPSATAPYVGTSGAGATFIQPEVVPTVPHGNNNNNSNDETGSLHNPNPHLQRQIQLLHDPNRSGHGNPILMTGVNLAASGDAVHIPDLSPDPSFSDFPAAGNIHFTEEHQAVDVFPLDQSNRDILNGMEAAYIAFD